MIEKQELWCHECERYVQFDIDLSLNGNHVIVCPNCGHEHCRVVENGIITEARWGSRNNVGGTVQNNVGGTVQNGYGIANSYMITTGTTSSLVSTYDTYTNNLSSSSATTIHRYSAWLTFGTGNGYI